MKVSWLRMSSKTCIIRAGSIVEIWELLQGVFAFSDLGSLGT